MLIFIFKYILFYFDEKAVVLVKTASLKNLEAIKSMDMKGVAKLCWEEKGRFRILDRNDFKTFSIADIKTASYATISCTKDEQWSTLVEFIFGSTGVQTEYVFLDAFCMNHSSKELVYKKKVMENRSKIFEHSKEHHIIEPDCLLYSETWYDLSFFNRRQRPTLHNSADDAVADEKLAKLIKTRGFDCVDASEAGEAEMKEFVKKSIVNRWGTMEKMNQRIQDTVVNALELSQVIKSILT